MRLTSTYRPIFVFIFFLFIALSSCVEPPVSKDGKTTHLSTKDSMDVSACMEKILYYNLNIDLDHYDSLGIYYMHEIKDYDDSLAILLFDSIQQCKKKLSNDTIRKNSDAVIMYQNKMDSLRNQLRPYKPVTTGYIFVHTFVQDSDTLSMIFVMDLDCNYSEAIPVKTIYDPNPEDYSSKIRSLHVRH